jgi:hypothetical protein
MVRDCRKYVFNPPKTFIPHKPNRFLNHVDKLCRLPLSLGVSQFHIILGSLDLALNKSPRRGAPTPTIYTPAQSSRVDHRHSIDGSDRDEVLAAYMLANLAVKEMEGEDIASFSPRAGATGPDLSGRLGLQVRVWRLTEQAAGVPEIGGCGACMTTVVCRGLLSVDDTGGIFLFL